MAKFQKGQSGNPKGRKKGSRNKITLAAETLLLGDAKKITRKCIELAILGDSVALRLAMERIAPPRKDHFVKFRFGKLQTADDAVKATTNILRAVSDGKITPAEAAELNDLVSSFCETLELKRISERVENLERGKT